MGSICSKQSAMAGGHRLVEEQNTEVAGQERPDPRIAAAQAAEQRLKAVSDYTVTSVYVLDTHVFHF